MKHVTKHRPGHWLPAGREPLHDFIARLLDEAETHARPLHPVVDELRQLIEGDAQLFMLFHEMFEELPRAPRFLKEPTGAPQIRDYKTMLKLFNIVLTRAPEFDSSGMVGLPINAILEWPMGTGAGTTVFLHREVNATLRRTLQEWARFLSSKDSCYVLTDEPDVGWFNEDARRAMPDFDRLSRTSSDRKRSVAAQRRSSVESARQATS